MGSKLVKNSNLARKRSEEHEFNDEYGDEYQESKFGGFPEYFRRKRVKLQNLDARIRSESTNQPQIFKGIVTYVNGYTQPSLQDIHHLVVSHGGCFMQYLDGKTSVTHIIASNLTLKKAKEFREYRIVKPAWIVESVAAGRLLQWDKYKVLHERPTQQLLQFNNGGIGFQKNVPQGGYHEQTDTCWYSKNLTTIINSIEDKHICDQSPSDPGKSYQLISDPSPIEKVEVKSQKTTPGTPQLFKRDLLPESLPIKSTLANELNKVDCNTGKIKNLMETPQSTSTSISQSPLFKKSRDHSNLGLKADLITNTKPRNISAADPKFIAQFYAESRLHHLSHWKSQLKSRFQKLACETAADQVTSLKRDSGARRYIIHVDMDSFFCSVSARNVTRCMQSPAAVAHGSGPGSEIASCNYPARSFGVKNGMWMKNALQICPQLQVLPYDFPAYEEASNQFYGAVLGIGGTVQSVSVDEALVDITNICHADSCADASQIDILREEEKAEEIARVLRQRIKKESGCDASVGIGPNILLAKLALRRAKPAGQYHIKPSEAQEFIGKLCIQDLPGVAQNIGGRLEKIGVKQVKDIHELTQATLLKILGPKTGRRVWEYSHGIDHSIVGHQSVRKSVSAEINWGIRFLSQKEADEFVRNLCRELEHRLVKQGLRGKQMTLKIMRKSDHAPSEPQKHLGHGICDSFSKSVVLDVATNQAETLGQEAVSILRSYRFLPTELRGIGVQMTRLESLEPTDVPPKNRVQKKISFNPTVARDTFSHVCSDSRVYAENPIKNKAITKQSPVTTGTQFVIPSQIDAGVLAELPCDIRTRLMAQSRTRSVIHPRPNLQTSSLSRSTGSHGSEPLPSQFDPEVFAALPPDLKTEVLENYKSSVAQAADSSHELGLANQPRTHPKPIHPTSPSTKCQRERPSISKPEPAAYPATPDPSFLAALPASVRADVLEDHWKQRRGAQKPKLFADRLELSKRCNEPFPPTVRHIILPTRKPRPTFTTQGLSSLADLRIKLGEWHKEFAMDGPHPDDAAAMVRYLRRVVLEERDLAKVVSLLRWLEWLIDENTESARGIEAWLVALKGIKENVQMAVRDRGLGYLDI
ncbi:DNA polymerase [Blumeria hordei DH14]|uniref:DNA repair protein REV1 n=1 Tax=Blumeria graminis f. sp. hordei (strain DH14) TaxID=546991 RepID=N1JED2_BLUG1|nr:DNA polymerase [Blumeria hordei DH14]